MSETAAEQRDIIAGLRPYGIDISADGSTAVVVNIGQWSQGNAFSADSKAILVQNAAEKQIQVLRWDGTMPSDSGHRQDKRERGRDPHRHGLI